MKAPDLISVIIPCYNREKLIKRAIKSLQDQTYSNIEIFVVDDCSTDNSVQVIKKQMETDSRIKLLENQTNSGANYSRNQGIRAAKGSYLSFLDSDDEWTPETLELLYKKITNCPEKVGAVYSGMLKILGEEKQKIYPKHRGEVFKKLMTEGTIGTYPLIKREVFEKVGLFDEHEILRKGGHQDYEMWIRIAQFYEFEYVNKLTLIYHFQQDSITFNTLIKNPEKKIRAYLYIWNKYRERIGNDREIYAFYCYKIFELLSAGKRRKLAKKVLFMGLKARPFQPRVYYHLLAYFNEFYSPIDIMARVEKYARTLWRGLR